MSVHVRTLSRLLCLFGALCVASAVTVALPSAKTGEDAPPPPRDTLTLARLRAMYGDRDGHTLSIDGTEVYYKDEGRGPAILLVHGSASTMAGYDSVVPLLRKHYRVIRYDVPGQGLSGPVSEAAARLDPADIAAGLLAQLRVEKVTAVGVSSGGTLCVYLAAKYPQLVERLILANTPADPVDTSHMRQPQAFLDAQRVARETQFRSQRFWDLFLTFFSGEPQRMTPSIRRQFFDFNRRVPEPNAISLVAKVAEHTKATEAMSLVHAPTLLVWGARDPLLTPPSADALAGYLTHTVVSKLLLPDVGHFPPIEVPERFASIVVSYIEAVTPVRPIAPPPEDR